MFGGMLFASALFLTGCLHNTSQVTTEQPLPIPAEEQPTEEEGVPTEAFETDQPGEVMIQTYALADIARHTTPEDCWFAIDGQVYDVTAFIASGNHGGGDTILEGCGKDATELYKTRPMGSGTDHSEKAYGFLANFEIGELTTQE